MTVGDNIRHYRKASGLTQEELADKLNVARSTIAQWERGWTKPNLGRVRDLAVVLNTSMSRIAGVDDASGNSREVPTSADSRIPLLSLENLDSIGLDAHMVEAEQTAEVPCGILSAHPHAKAVVVTNDCMDRVIPPGMVAVFDPALEPQNDQIALLTTPEHGVVLRRWFRAGSTLILVADSHQPHDDIVLASDAPLSLLGTVVWAQPLTELL